MPPKVSERRPGSDMLSQGDGASTRAPRLVPAITVLILVLGAAALAWKISADNRLANLAYRGEGGFPETFLMLSKSRPGRGYVVDRRGSTVRRSESKLQGNMRDLTRFGGDPDTESPQYWLARSKKYPTVLLVPVEEVPDWTYPFLYGFVRERFPDLELPKGTWTHLHVNRMYRGLYYRLDFPYDLRKKDGGTGVRREFLMIEGNSMAILDTRFDPGARLYASLVADGVMPELVEPSAELGWLVARHPEPEEATFLLTNALPWKIRRMPLPISIRDFSELQLGRPLALTTDERFRRWTETSQQPEPGLTDEADTALREEFARYASDFRAAYRAHRVLNPSAAARNPPREPPDGLATLQLEARP